MRAMSTTNAQPQQATCAEEEEQQQHGRAKAEQQQSQQWPRRRGGGGASRSPAENPSQGRRCARCGGAFGRFYNTGASCPRCRHRVCRQCREFRGSATTAANNKGEDHGVDWLCAVCHKIAELHAATGEWIYEAASVTSSRLVAAKKKSTVDIIKRSIRRAWTINGPPARWSVARKSPAFRIYRSLPVREKIHPRLSDEADVEPDENFPSPQSTETLARNYDSDSLVSHSDVGQKNVEGVVKRKGDKIDDAKIDDDGESNQAEKLTRNDRTKDERRQQLDHSTSCESSKTRRNERETSTVDTTDRAKTTEQPIGDCSVANDANSPRVSLLKPPRILAKFAATEGSRQSPKHGDRKSSIPIFRRSSREFEDIGSPQETAKRSLIPQRYRGSTDDLRRSREDISLPSLIPKLFSPRSRDPERLKRHDSRDDVRQLARGTSTPRRDASRETAREQETRTSLSSPNVREDHQQNRSGLRIFRREDVGRETTSLPSLCVSRGKITGKDERHERSVGETIARSKSCPSEQGKTSSKAATTILTRDKEEGKAEVAIGTKTVDDERGTEGGIEISFASEAAEQEKSVEDEKIVATMANEKTTTTTTIDSPEAKPSREWHEKSIERDEKEEEKEDEEEIGNLVVLSCENRESIVGGDKETSFVEAANFTETDFAGGIVGERKVAAEGICVKRVDDMQQVVRRKFSKEELSNPDDTDETPNRRSSSHLSPEASPLSTRSSRYSPRESESEPTPALPRKTGSGDSCTASQRIRDAITRTRRESNSSARYESSGSESVRLSESGLHGYADLARRVKLFGSGGNSPGPSAGSDEPVQRDSATSAGEDDPSEDCHSRGPGSSQGRTMLRRRRQFDAQGSRRRGRSHARTCCGEELQNFPALHVIGRGGGGRQPSPPQGQNPEAPNPDYRRLVFISSDSSSGREEDDADSSCSGSSYLKTRNSHAQGLEDCDWDYFESGTLPLPAGVLPDPTINVGHVGVDPGISQSWSCCPGRGSAACLACGGSPGANVLPVPVPIPVPVPYPVPVPASLWTGDFAAAASSMITRGAAPEGTLRLRGDPSAPWFSWHPRFNQPLHGARIDPRAAIGAFDPSAFGFRPEEITPRLYGRESLVNSLINPPKTSTTDSTLPADNSKNVQIERQFERQFERQIEGQIESQTESQTEGQTESQTESQTEGQTESQTEGQTESQTESQTEGQTESQTEGQTEDQTADQIEGRIESQIKLLIEHQSEDQIGGQIENQIEVQIDQIESQIEGQIDQIESQINHQIEHQIEQIEEIPAKESSEIAEPEVADSEEEKLADSDDTEDSSRSTSSSNRMYRRSRDDSGSSSGRSSADSSDLEDSASHRFSRVFVVNDDSLTSDNELEDNEDSDSAREGVVTLRRVTSRPEDDEPVVLRRVRLLDEDANLRKENAGDNLENAAGMRERRANRIERRVDLLDPDANEIYLASSTDFSDSQIQLKSIKNINPDSIEVSCRRDNDRSCDLREESRNWDSVITPDSLEVVEECRYGEESKENLGNVFSREESFLGAERTRDLEDEADNSPAISNGDADKTNVLSLNGAKGEETAKGNAMGNSSSCSATDSSENNTTGSEVSSDELHEYEVSPYEILEAANARRFATETTPIRDKILAGGAANERNVTPMPRRNLLNSSLDPDANSPRLFVSTPRKETPTVPPRGKPFEADGKTSADVKQSNRTTPTPSAAARNSGASAPNPGNVGDMISSRIHEMFKSSFLPSSPDSAGVASDSRSSSSSLIVTGLENDSLVTPAANVACDSRPSSSLIGTGLENDSLGSPAANVAIETARPAIRDAAASRGSEQPGRQVGAAAAGGEGGSEKSGRQVGAAAGGEGEIGSNAEEEEEEEKAGGGNGASSARFRSVERRPPARKENGGCRPAAVTPDQPRATNFPPNNKYRSLVMITQGAYQPVSVVTSDTTTLLQSPEDAAQQPLNPQGLAGYFHLALEAVNEPNARQRNGQPPRRPLMVKRLAAAAASEQEIDSGLSVGSASESDDVQNVKSQHRIVQQQQQQQQQQSHDVNVPKTSVECFAFDSRNSRNSRNSQNSQNLLNSSNSQNSPNSTAKVPLSPSSSDENSAPGPVILEEGLADDDSWVEEVSHDEDEASATTATEESSEDEANNLGDREEELRGYHRQAIDFTLHTIVEESCEESEAEPSIAGGPRKKQRPPSASELEKYFFFGLGGDGSGGAASVNSREVDSLSETSSIYSEGLESLGQEEASPTAGQDGGKTTNEFFNSSRLEKYFLSEFLGFDQDRRDSDGSVGSDSEGRPSPEAQRRKRLVRARGTGRSSHSSSLDNLLALAQGTQNLSSQNSLQDLSLNQELQETQSEGSSTETDGAEDGQTAAFGTDGQFDTVKRKKKKPRTLGTQSPRVPEDRNKTPEPRDNNIGSGEMVENDGEGGNSEDERAKTPQPESAMHSSSSSSSQVDAARSSQSSDTGSSRSKQQSRDSGFVGSCDDLLQHQKSPGDQSSHEGHSDHPTKDHSRGDRSARGVQEGKRAGKSDLLQSNSSGSNLQPPPNASLSRKDSFNNWSSDEETNLMMSKMRQFFKTMVANTNGGQAPAGNSSGPSPAPSPRLSGYSKARLSAQNRTKPPQLVYFENELTRLMKTVPGIRDEQVREIVEYLSSEDTWSDSYDSSDYTSSDLEGAAGGRRSALQEQISQSCQQIISKFDVSSAEGGILSQEKGQANLPAATSTPPQPCLGRDTAFVYQKLVQSFTKIAADGPSNPENSNSSATPHSSPPLIAKVMHHIGSRLVALMHEVSEGGSTVQPHTTWRRYSQHHRTPSSASTTEDDDSTSDSTNPPPSNHLPRSKSHDPLLLINGHPATNAGQEGEEREASDYERFSWRGSFESALMAADSRTKLSLLACSGDVSASASASALAMAAKRRSAGDLLFNPKSFSREQLDRVRSCGSIGGGSGGGAGVAGGSIEEKIWSNRRRSSVPDANTRGESGASAGDDDTEDELEYGGDPRATTLPRGMQAAAAAAASAATNSLPRLPASTAPGGGGATATSSSTPMHKAHSVYHFLPQHTGVKSARYRPPGFARNSLGNAGGTGGPKRAVSAPGLQVSGSQASAGKRETSRTRRQQAISLTPDDGSSLSEACSTPIIGAGSRAGSSHTVMDIDDMDRGLHSGHLATRASLSSLGARSDSMASVYSGAGEGRWCGSVAVRGEVEFSLQYDYKQLTFEVHVTQCKDLAPVDIKRNRSDPYVKVYLLPDKSKSGKRKTKVKKHTLNPVFDETLKFHMSLNGLETRTLWLTVWHSDMFGRNDFLGEVRMPLENKIFDDPTPRWYPLQERTEPFDDPVSYKGEVIVGLKFIPPDPAQLERERETSIDHRGLSKGRKNWSRGSLHVLVKEARNLQTRAKNSGTCDPFCKSYLLPDKGRSGKQKTGVVRRSGGSPVWTHTFVYKDVSLQELAERGLELTVWDHDRIASNEFLGGVRFNLGTGKHYGKVVDWMDATGRELSLWQSMLERPNFWVEGAVTLRPNLHNHVKSGGT